MDKDEELEWIKSSQNGDLVAFGKLATKYQNQVYTLAMRLLKNKHDAEDLSQDVLIKVFNSISQYKSHSPFGAWIYRITYNESINKIRKTKRNRETHELNDNSGSNWVDTKNALKTIETEERKEIILTALDKLSEIDRFLIMSYYFEELPIKEISDITGLSVSNIKIKLHRSRKVLSEFLNKSILTESLL